MGDGPQEEPTSCTEVSGSGSQAAGASDKPTNPNEYSPNDHIALPSNELIEIHRHLSEISDLLVKRLSRDKVKEEAFDRLYEELDAIKRNKAFEDNRPLFLDLILLYDRMEAVKVNGDVRSTSALESLQEELMEIFLRREIEPMQPALRLFDPTFQKAVSTEKVESAELDGKAMRVVRTGFACKGKVLRPQEVVVGRYQPQPSLSGSCDKSSDHEKEKL